jgi:hypothetical protein
MFNTIGKIYWKSVRKHARQLLSSNLIKMNGINFPARAAPAAVFDAKSASIASPIG